MATIKLNAKELDKKIKGLRNLANKCETERTHIDAQSEQENDPYDITQWLLDSDTAISTLKDRADGIQTAKDNLIALNNNGVAKMEGEVITYTLPDDAPVDDLEDLTRWTTGAIDAHDLQETAQGKTPKSGRTYEQVIASMEKYVELSNTYAASVIESIGPENLADLPFDASRLGEGYHYGETTKDPQAEERAEKLAELLGSVLAAASGTWDSSKSQKVAEQIRSSADERGEYGRITVINAMMGGHDEDGNYVNDLGFGSHFLASMGREMEKIDYDDVRNCLEVLSLNGDKTTNDANRSKFLGPSLDGYSYDPLAGTLDAMGNNPEAALAYLVPNQSESGDSSIDASRIERLSERDWDAQGLAGFTAALAAGSSRRYSDNAREASRAEAVAGHGVHWLAKNTNENQYNEAAEARIGVLLANCAPELTNVWGGDGDDGFDSTTGGRIPLAGENDFNALAYRVAENQNATATISANLTEFARRQSAQGIAENEGNPQDQIAAINAAYNPAGKAVAFLAGLADVRVGIVNAEMADADEKRSQSAETAVSVLTTVATTGLGAATGPVGAVAGSAVGQAAIGAGTTLLSPVLEDAIDGDSAVPAKMPISEQVDDSIRAAAIQDAANAGLFNPQDFEVPVESEAADNKFYPASTVYDWIKQREDGSYYIDLSKTPPEKIDEAEDWSNFAKTNGNAAFEELEDGYDGGAARAQDRGVSVAKRIEGIE